MEERPICEECGKRPSTERLWINNIECYDLCEICYQVVERESNSQTKGD